MNFQWLPGHIDLNTWMWHSVFNRAGGVQPKVGLSLGGFFPALMTPYHTLYWERSKSFKEWCNFIKIISGVTPGLVQQLCSNSDHHRHATTQSKFWTAAMASTGISAASAAYTSSNSEEQGVKKFQLDRTHLNWVGALSVHADLLGVFQCLKSSKTQVLQVSQEPLILAVSDK